MINVINYKTLMDIINKVSEYSQNKGKYIVINTYTTTAVLVTPSECITKEFKQLDSAMGWLNDNYIS